MGGDACDTQGLTQCQTDYFAAAPGATGTQVCDAVGTLASCMNSKGAGCPSAALAQFNTVVDQAKAPLCTATGTCSNTTLCTGASNTGPGRARVLLGQHHYPFSRCLAFILELCGEMVSVFVLMLVAFCPCVLNPNLF